MIKEILYYFEGIDESILKLNYYLKDNYFEFIRYNLNQFEKKFLPCFSEEENFRKYGTVSETIESSVINYKYENLSILFINWLEDSKYFNSSEIITSGYVIFLQDKFLYESRVDNEVVEEEEEETEINQRIRELISKLKLFKQGHIKLISSFIIQEEMKWYFPDSYSFPSKFITYQKFSLQETDISNLNYLNNNLLIPQYLELAFNAFLENYNIEDERLKFIVLIISLESIFNKSSQDPITHIISRHVALLISEDKKSFFEVYDEVKRLYNVRSSIVHGKDEKETKKDFKNLDNDVLRLEDIVRTVLKKLIWIHDFDLDMPKDKKELWSYLNAKGFEG